MNCGVFKTLSRQKAKIPSACLLFPFLGSVGCSSEHTVDMHAGSTID